MAEIPKAEDGHEVPADDEPLPPIPYDPIYENRRTAAPPLAWRR